MEASIYGWVKDIIFYLILMTMLMNLLPDNKYRKYVRLFAGMLLIIIVVSPISKLFSWNTILEINFLEKIYQQEVSSLTVELNKTENSQQQEFLQNYEGTLRSRIIQLAAEQNLSVLNMKIELEENQEDERYLYPKSIEMLVSGDNQESIVENINVSKVDISMKNEEETGGVLETKKENLKNVIADFYQMDCTNINIVVQE